MFSHLCGMHLETESDGEQELQAAFANYNPGNRKSFLFINGALFIYLFEPTFSPCPWLFLRKGDSSEEDSDECNCGHGRCVRSYLGTMCECNPGFRLDYSRARCIGLSFMYSSKILSYLPNIICFLMNIRAVAFMTCPCFVFFFPDIDECAESGARASPCKNARCVNTSGSYKCLCKHGFVPTRRPNVCARRRSQ